jgi:hypothetical protein
MSGAFYSDLHPHGYGGWIKNHLRLKTETVEAAFSFFVLWVVLMLFSYIVSLLMYWALKGLGIIQKSLYSFIIGLSS